MESTIGTMSLCDLIEIKSILEKRLSEKEKWVEAERGKNYEEFSRKSVIYYKDENHGKLKRITQRIEEIITTI